MSGRSCFWLFIHIFDTIFPMHYSSSGTMLSEKMLHFSFMDVMIQLIMCVNTTEIAPSAELIHRIFK